MELRQYLAVLWRWWWLIVLCTAVAAFCSWWVVKDQPNIYRTSTTLMIGSAIEKSNPTTSDLVSSERLAQTYSELIKREIILSAVARALGFEDQWPALREKISTNQIQGTQLMEILVTDTDPQRAKLIANEVARQLIDIVQQSNPASINRAFIEEEAASLPTKIRAAQKETQDLEAQLGTAFSARQIVELQNRISTLESQISNWQTAFAQYQSLLGEGNVNALKVVEAASLPTKPIGPQWIIEVLLAAAIGMILAVGTVFLVEYLDDTLKVPEDVTKATGLTMLGAIGRMKAGDPAARLITVRHPRSPISEAYRALRTNLQFSSLDHPLKSLVVTSPNPIEGKSTTLSNLGVVMAQAGKSVVLVDSDLRRPMLHKIFQLSNREGLTSILLQEEPVLDGRLQETGIQNLRVLTSGPLPPNPSELLTSQKMSRFIAELEKEADVIIFDSPPALPVTDAAVLSTQTDGVLIVADAGRTRRAAARQTVENLQKVGINVLGVALNRLSPRRSGSHYYYYYYFSEDNQGRRRKRRRWYQRLPLPGRSKK
jgi:succinoglycan biosynthesis transport protein ExoP